MNPKDLLTPWHEGFDDVSEKTKVIFLGNSILKLTHCCFLKTSTGNPYPKSVELKLHAPTHAARSAAYCKLCDTLYVGDEQ